MAGSPAVSAGRLLAFRDGLEHSREGPWEVIAPRSSCSGGECTPLRGAADLRIITLSQRSDARCARRSGVLFPPTRGGCVPSAGQVNIVSFETSSARLVSSPPLLSSGGVVPAGPPKWLPPRPPLTTFAQAGSKIPVTSSLSAHAAAQLGEADGREPGRSRLTG